MLIYAHRGASDLAPENTFSAFFLGPALGANGIETDIQETKDKVLVLFHDDTLKRITGLERSISELTYQDLLTLDFGRYKGQAFLGEKIVTLDDFLKYFSGRPLKLALEIKQKGIEKAVLAAISHFDCSDQVVITSFIWPSLCAVRELNQTIQLGFLTERISQDILSSLAEQSVGQICPDTQKLSAADVALARRHGFNIRGWNVADKNAMKRAVELEIDGVTVNSPDQMITHLTFAQNKKEALFQPLNPALIRPIGSPEDTRV